MSRQDASPSPQLPASDPLFHQQMMRLHRLQVYGRWLLVLFLWLLIAPICLWSLRNEFALWQDYFTWTAVRFTIVYNRIPVMGLALCVGWAIAVLLWQSRNILFGIPKDEQQRLAQQVWRIRQQGESHPLWKWVCGGEGSGE
jgi:hypothetical protein